MKKVVKNLSLLAVLLLFICSSCRKTDDGEYDRSDFEDAAASTEISGQEFFS